MRFKIAILAFSFLSNQAYAQVPLRCEDLFDTILHPGIYSFLGAGKIPFFVDDYFKLKPGPLKEVVKKFLREKGEEDSRYARYGFLGGSREFLDRTPLSDEMGSVTVSGLGDTVYMTTKGVGKSTAPRDALALTVDGGIHKQRFDSGSPSLDQSQRAVLFQTTTPVVAVKVVAIGKTDKSDSQYGVFAIDQNGSMYFHFISTKRTMSMVSSLKIRNRAAEAGQLGNRHQPDKFDFDFSQIPAANNVGGDVNAGPSSLKGIPLNDILPSNVVLTKQRFQAFMGGSEKIVVSDEIEVSYISASGLEIVAIFHKGMPSSQFR